VDLFPSIDVREGVVVRLLRGDYSLQTTYDVDPVGVARRFDAAGARWIHVVDLDAARSGGNPNLAVIEAICANVSAKVQTGGGVRTVSDASDRLAAGVARVVVGSAAVEHPEVVDELATLHPGQVAVGLDAAVVTSRSTVGPSRPVSISSRSRNGSRGRASPRSSRPTSAATAPSRVRMPPRTQPCSTPSTWR
jgi:phosphoribosylformimino-5-aminoimidazole carboxamide ribonucleotide (ProFAR) isomerase